MASTKDNDFKMILDDAAYSLESVEGFRDLVEDFLKATGLSQTVFSYEAAGMVDFVRLMRKGRDFRLSTAAKVLRWMARYEKPPIG